MPEHTITTDCVWRNWLGGTVGGLPFAAKICDVNSPDGIDNGRVLKLFLYADEIYPLVEWGITEAQALKICYDRGFDWNGLYEIYHRCSCWCCPFQRIGELKNLRCHHPELWARLRELDKRALDQFGHSALGRFKDNWNVEQLEHRFAAEDAARKEAEMEQDKSKEIRDMLKGVPPKNVIIAIDDLPPKTLEQHLKDRQKGQKKPQKRKKGR